MRLERITFQEDPAVYTAQLLIEEKLDPLTTMVVAPTQRFKIYLAFEQYTLTPDCYKL